MKTRRQIIDSILEVNRKHSPSRRDYTLETALLNMQDAMLFQLASDLEISLEPDTRTIVHDHEVTL